MSNGTLRDGAVMRNSKTPDLMQKLKGNRSIDTTESSGQRLRGAPAGCVGGPEGAGARFELPSSPSPDSAPARRGTLPRRIAPPDHWLLGTTVDSLPEQADPWG